MRESHFSKQVLDLLESTHDLLQSQTIRDFCQPFFNAFDINYFDYTRLYPDNSCHTFSSDLSYVKFFLDYSHVVHRTTQDRYDLPTNVLTPGKHLWQHYLDTNFLLHANENFDRLIGLTVVNVHPSYYELYNFSAPFSNNKIIDLYLNQDYILDIFVACFTDQFSHVLNKKDNRITLPSLKVSPADTSYEDELYEKLSQALATMMKIRKNNTLIYVQDQLIQLSKREFNCLSLIIQGKSAKEIARLFNISPKTAEIHCSSLLRKTNSANRVEMINKLNKNFIEWVSHSRI